MSTGICSSLAVNQLSSVQTQHLFSLFHVCFVPSDRTSLVKQRVWPSASRAKRRHCETHCVFQNLRFLYTRNTTCSELYETEILLSFVWFFGTRLFYVRLWWITMFRVDLCVYSPSECSRKHKHQPWRVAFSWLGTPLGAGFHIITMKETALKQATICLRTDTCRFVDKNPHKMQRWNRPPYELLKEWTQRWIYRLPMCNSGCWPQPFRVKAACPWGLSVGN